MDQLPCCCGLIMQTIHVMSRAAGCQRCAERKAQNTRPKAQSSKHCNQRRVVLSPVRPLTPSPCHPLTPSPVHPLTPSPLGSQDLLHLLSLGEFIDEFVEVATLLCERILDVFNPVAADDAFDEMGVRVDLCFRKELPER